MGTMRSRIRSAALGWACWGLAGATWACSCQPPGTPQEELASAGAVFQGTVVHVSDDEGAFERTVAFRVDRVWKGPADPLIAISTPKESAMCGVSFALGTEYVVYTDSNSPSNVYACSRTRAAASASADLGALGAGAASQNASIEVLTRQAAFAGSWFNPERSGEGLQVEILQDGRGVVSWFGYRPDEPRQQSWLVGIGTFQGNSLPIPDMQRPVGGGFGVFYDPNAVERVVWGEVRLDFELDGTARLHWSSVQPEFGSGEFALQRLTRAPRVAPPSSID